MIATTNAGEEKKKQPHTRQRRESKNRQQYISPSLARPNQHTQLFFFPHQKPQREGSKLGHTCVVYQQCQNWASGHEERTKMKQSSTGRKSVFFSLVSIRYSAPFRHPCTALPLFPANEHLARPETTDSSRSRSRSKQQQQQNQRKSRNNEPM